MKLSVRQLRIIKKALREHKEKLEKTGGLLTELKETDNIIEIITDKLLEV
ncbi:MAG: hypothetical protein ACI3ZQ_04910 [Candidatus Cryptobacteroides sp.]